MSGDDVFELQVFPNPTESQTTACLMSKYMTSGVIEIFNTAGQVVNSIEVDSIHNTHKHFELNLSGLESGTYHVRFSNKVFSTGKTLVVK
ncbi:T9SS type A sorting domain-containing protein [Flavobacteriales bacterium]|nr:T9SS type A sorting domain-containing protein [Flavobacteriales bacterium]